MALENINQFIKETAELALKNIWSNEVAKEVCGKKVPDGIFHENQSILQADATTLWLRWFVESVCSPTNYIEDFSKNEVHIYQDALRNINSAFSSSPKPYREELASLISKRIYSDVKLERAIGRTFATKEQRLRLVASSSEPRCWICGYKFTEEALDQFTGKKGRNPIVLPQLVDIFRPRGIHKNDLRIDVEHIVPVSQGGQGDENLALACGWCNRYKSSRTSIYDVTSKPYRVKFKLGENTRFELPNPFWIVRMSATHQKCQHNDGCEKSVKNSELFISPVNSIGSPNPTNLKVFCSSHDPLAFERSVSRESARAIWANKRKKLIFDFEEDD